MAQITLTAAPDNLEAAIAFVDRQMQAAGCPVKTMRQIELAVEEIFVNIARYAYAPAQGPVTLTCEAEGNPCSVTVTFSDQGRPYNPLEREDPDLTLGAEEREIGGLGILMVKNLMDEVHYEFQAGTNRLRMQKRS